MSNLAINLEGVAELNRLKVFKLLVRGQADTRAGLARMTGLRQATLTNIVHWFIENDVVEETNLIRGEKGHRSIALRLKSENYLVVGIRVTRRRFLISLHDISGRVYQEEEYVLDFEKGGVSAFNEIKSAVAQVIKSRKEGRIVAIGLAIPGPYLQHEGRVAFMSEFPGWEDIYIGKMLEDEFDIPAFVEHDAHAAAFAEWANSRHPEKGTLVYINAGYGVGMGVIIDGKTYSGTLGIAGEIGHISINFDGRKCICGNRGCLEHYCSMVEVEAKLEEWLKSNPESLLKSKPSFNDIRNAIIAGEEYPLHLIEESAKYLGFALANIVNMYNPDTIVIDGYLAKASDRFIEVARETAGEIIPPAVFDSVEIRSASPSINQFLAGAVELAIDKMLDTFDGMYCMLFEQQ